jgi:thioredoxin-like negative regulator of GroEL
MKRPPKQLDKISFKEYQEMVRSGRKVLVDFYTTWSVPSKKMEPIIEQITLENKNSLIVIRINADENQSLINELGLETFPEFKIYKEGIEVWKHNGIIEKKVLEDKLKH